MAGTMKKTETEKREREKEKRDEFFLGDVGTLEQTQNTKKIFLI